MKIWFKVMKENDIQVVQLNKVATFYFNLFCLNSCQKIITFIERIPTTVLEESTVYTDCTRIKVSKEKKIEQLYSTDCLVLNRPVQINGLFKLGVCLKFIA